MDTATILIVERLLAIASVRETARLLARPPASVSAALRRAEDALATPLLQIAGSGLMRTLDGERMQPGFEEMARQVRSIFGVAGTTSVPSVSLVALQRLLVVARKGSIRAAARELGLGQPQLTRQLAQMEAKIGQPMLERRHGGAAPTTAGLEVIAAIRRLEDIWRDMSASSSERFRRNVTTVRVGSVFPLGAESSIAGLLARLSAQWRLRHPRLPLFITSMIAEELLNGVRRGLFDVVLLDLDQLPSDLEGVELSRSPLVLVASRETAERAGGTLASLILTSPLAVPSARSGLRQIIDRILASDAFLDMRSGLDPVEVDSIPVILRLVEDHGFISILPGASLSGHGERLAALALPEPATLPLYAAWPKEKGDRGLIAEVVALARR
jgi:molybdate transport repressor ModE-like protein